MGRALHGTVMAGAALAALRFVGQWCGMCKDVQAVRLQQAMISEWEKVCRASLDACGRDSWQHGFITR